MANNEMFFAHAKCGFAVFIGKTMTGSVWHIPSGAGARMARLTEFLAAIDDDEIRRCYYNSQLRESGVESFMILTGETFGKVWTTPSGHMFNWHDRVDPSTFANAPPEALGMTPKHGTLRFIGTPPDEDEEEMDLSSIFQISLL